MAYKDHGSFLHPYVVVGGMELALDSKVGIGDGQNTMLSPRPSGP